MKEYTMNELAIGVSTIITALGALCMIIFKSRCIRIKLCSCLEVERSVPKDVSTKSIV